MPDRYQKREAEYRTRHPLKNYNLENPYIELLLHNRHILNSILIEPLEDSFLPEEYLTYMYRIDEAESNLSRLEFNLLSILNNDDDILDLGSISSRTSSCIIVEEFVDYDLDNTGYILSTYSLFLSQ